MTYASRRVHLSPPARVRSPCLAHPSGRQCGGPLTRKPSRKQRHQLGVLMPGRTSPRSRLWVVTTSSRKRQACRTVPRSDRRARRWSPGSWPVRPSRARAQAMRPSPSTSGAHPLPPPTRQLEAVLSVEAVLSGTFRPARCSSSSRAVPGSAQPPCARCPRSARSERWGRPISSRPRALRQPRPSSRRPPPGGRRIPTRQDRRGQPQPGAGSLRHPSLECDTETSLALTCGIDIWR